MPHMISSRARGRVGSRQSTKLGLPPQHAVSLIRFYPLRQSIEANLAFSEQLYTIGVVVWEFHSIETERGNGGGFECFQSLPSTSKYGGERKGNE